MGHKKCMVKKLGRMSRSLKITALHNIMAVYYTIYTRTKIYYARYNNYSIS